MTATNPPSYMLVCEGKLTSGDWTENVEGEGGEETQLIHSNEVLKWMKEYVLLIIKIGDDIDNCNDIADKNEIIFKTYFVVLSLDSRHCDCVKVLR